VNDLPIDENFHRAYVGPATEYDVGAAHQFNLLTMGLGLREYHHLLEIGCGSLRAGRLFIPYLLPDHYCGLEPNRWLVDAGIAKELGNDLASLRRPVFRHNDDFNLRGFERTFDFIVAQSIFSHTSQKQMAACLAEAHAVLAPDGLFAASFFEGDEDYTGDAWVYPEGVAFRMETVQGLAEHAGLGCRVLNWGNQNQQRWVVFHHFEHKANLPVFDEIVANRAATAALRDRQASGQRAGISPADYVRVRERLMHIEEHPVVQAAMAEHADLRRLIKGEQG
jgi:SAM-dependent methyltransferase